MSAGAERFENRAQQPRILDAALELLGEPRQGGATERAQQRCALARGAARVSLCPLVLRRLRPGALGHGYATAHSAVHFWLLSAHALGSVGSGAPAKATAGADRPARRASAGQSAGESITSGTGSNRLDRAR